jgi:hypothetical protein
LAKPVLYKARIISAPRFPIPQQARFTLSLAPNFGTWVSADAELKRIDGTAATADNASAFFKNNLLGELFIFLSFRLSGLLI